MTSNNTMTKATIKKSAIAIIAALSLAVLVFGGKAVADNVVTYETNAAGMTYGSAIDAPTPDSEPDLIQAVATNGEVGYVKKSELHAASRPASNPEEAVAMMLERERTQKAAFHTELDSQSARKGAKMSLTESETSALFDEILNNPNGPNTAASRITNDDNTFDEAMLTQALNVALESTRQQIPVYAIDGETIIGNFIVD